MLEILVSLALFNLFGAMIPGPDFMVVTRNALVSRKQGFYTALGIGTGFIWHTLLAFLGLGMVREKFPGFFSYVQWAGACFLGYLAFKMFAGLLKAEGGASRYSTSDRYTATSWAKSYLKGLSTNVLNPNVYLLLASVVTQVMNGSVDSSAWPLLGATVVIVNFSWLMVLTMFFSNKNVQKAIQKVGNLVDFVFGTALLYFSFKMVV